ncbi:MAG TPA: DUF6279 family lipoprotein [Roseateles sp.]|uniref:DUF6279 family lipoprotein n=1 Tax=Roseateles sp. TaxID=1971397 RepID=UPI002ED8B5A5
MRLLKRLATLLSLSLMLGLVGCSSLSLAYNQMPLLAGLWVDHYLDLDSAQRGRLKDALQAWQAWHRREELPQWLALLRQGQAALDGGVTPDELAALERGAQASLERCLQHAAPLAAPLLAELRPAQWQHLQKTMDEKNAEWQAKVGGRGGAAERAKRYITNLERWLGDLDRSTRRQARADAEGWHFDLAAMAQGRATRQARTLEGLRAWSRQDLAGGTAVFMRNVQTLPGEQLYRDQITASLLQLLNGLDARQLQQVRKHWADWSAELHRLQAN